jgi:3-hydroxyisobutyrate dehydrogenase-like beta-hydroxyacid dehydrogenase
MSNIGLLHPGEMGVSVAASAIHSGHHVYWVSPGRSDKTRSRAEKCHLVELDALSQLCQTSEIIICVCPPHAAGEVAQSVLRAGFTGLYLDANAISPQRSIRIGEQMQAAGIRYVDGGIIGGPAWTPKETWLYVSGSEAEEIAECFTNGPLEVKILGKEIGKASALKMCYAAYTKGTTALLAAIVAAAEELGVRDDLYTHWDMDQVNFSEQTNARVARVTTRAWRFEGEMREISTGFQEAGLPGEFHKAAAEIYHRMADFKDSTSTPPLHEVIRSLLMK